jgi:hypothetical protein
MVNSNDIMSILNISPSFEIKEINNMIIKEVINNSLKNNYEEIKEYLIKNWK